MKNPLHVDIFSLFLNEEELLFSKRKLMRILALFYIFVNLIVFA
jgi:hypothetical protein